MYLYILKSLYYFLAFLFPFGSANFMDLDKFAEEVEGEQNSFLPIVYGLCLIFSLLSPTVREKFKYTKSLILPLIIFYIAISLAELFYGSTIDYMFYLKLIVAITGFIVIAQTFIAYPSLLKESLLIYAYVSSLIIIAFLLGFLENSYYFSNDRLWFLGVNPNTYSFMMGFASIVLVYYNQSLTKKYLILLNYILTILLIYFVILTGSRGSLLFLFLAFGIIFYKKIHIFILISLIIPFIISIFHTTVEQEIVVFDRISELQKGGDPREKLIEQTLSIFEEYPILGAGSTGYKEQMLNLYQENKDSHNLLVSSLALSGFLGTLALIYFLINLFIQSIQKSKYRLMSSTIFLFMFMVSMKTGSILTYSLMWYIFSIVLALNIIGRKNTNLEEGISYGSKPQ